MAERIKDFAAWSTIAMWLGASWVAFLGNDGDLFQKLGTIGISIGVVYFLVQKQGVPVPEGYNEVFTLTQQTLREHTKRLDQLDRALSDIAREIAEGMEKNGHSSRPETSEMSRLHLDPPSTAMRLSQNEGVEKLEKIESHAYFANWFVKRQLRFSAITQGVLVVLGTLQTGFGNDLVSTICGRSQSC